MDEAKRIIIRKWLETSRGKLIQQAVADAMIEAGYKMDRTRYGRYETGSLPIGPKVYANFLGYWKSQGVDGPDFTPPKEPEAPVDPLAAAINELVVELRRWREEDRARIAELEAMVDGLVSAGPAAQGSAVGAERPALRRTTG